MGSRWGDVALGSSRSPGFLFLRGLLSHRAASVLPCLRSVVAATVGGLSRGLADGVRAVVGPSWGSGFRGVALIVAIGYLSLIACCKIIVPRPCQNCKSNIVLFVSIFVPAHSTFISCGFGNKNSRIPRLRNCNHILLYNKMLHSDFLLQFCPICGII